MGQQGGSILTVTGPEERYRTDPEFYRLVTWIEALIYKAEFTPTEIREAAMLACIHREETSTRHLNPFPPRVETRSTNGRLGIPPPAVVILDGVRYHRGEGD